MLCLTSKVVGMVEGSNGKLNQEEKSVLCSAHHSQWVRARLDFI